MKKILFVMILLIASVCFGQETQSDSLLVKQYQGDLSLINEEVLKIEKEIEKLRSNYIEEVKKRQQQLATLQGAGNYISLKLKQIQTLSPPDSTKYTP